MLARGYRHCWRGSLTRLRRDCHPFATLRAGSGSFAKGEAKRLLAMTRLRGFALVKDQEHIPILALIEFVQILEVEFFVLGGVNLGYRPAILNEPSGLRVDCSEGALPKLVVLRRGDEDVVEGAIGDARQVAEGIALHHLRALSQLSGGQVGIDGLDGGALVIDEAGEASALAERLDAERAGAGEQVQERGTLEHGAQDVEEGFFGAISDRAGLVAGHGF